MRSTQPKPNSFLFPILQLSYSDAIINGFERLYTGNTEYEGGIAWGNYLFALFNKTKVSVPFFEQITRHNLYKDYYYPSEDKLMIIFEIPEDLKTTVVKPFLEGKYSKMDKHYIRANFRKFTSGGELSINWRILHRDPLLRQRWERILNISLPNDAEVWAKPEQQEDIFKYNAND